MSSSTLFKSSQHIACYLAQEKEFNCSPIIDVVLAAQKNCYLPVISKKDEKKLAFAPYHTGDKTQFNRYGILEPVSSTFFPPEKLDLVIVPLIGFDQQGNRLGTGGGYYDTTFAFLLNQPRGKPFLLGLGYESQGVNQLPTDPWDVELDGVLGERGLLCF